MDSVFQELRRAREAKRLSINDVSDATLINPGFLDAIEQGKTDILPQTYVRAFIREYASVVGLDPVEIMKHYDRTREEATNPPPAPQPPPPSPKREHGETPRAEQAAQPTYHPREPSAMGRFALPAILLLILTIVIWNLTRTKSPPETKEIAFESPTRGSATPVDSTAIKSSAHSSRATTDSLTLRAIVSDSAWVAIVIDNLEPREYLFRPNRKITWKAKERFRITTGNAGAIDLTLNDKHLGAPGKRGAVARNIEFNRQTLLKK